MSYSGVGAVGQSEWTNADVGECPLPWQDAESDFCVFNGSLYDTDEVYVVRISGSLVKPIEMPHQALRFVKAYANSLLTLPGVGVEQQDVRGVVVRPTGPADHYTFDIVYTSPTSGPAILPQRSIAGILDGMQKNEDLLREYPELRLDNAESLRLLRPDAAIRKWMDAPPLWSSQLWESQSKVAPEARGLTSVWSNHQGVFVGAVDPKTGNLVATAAHPGKQLKPVEPPAIGPPGAYPPPPGDKPEGGGLSTAELVIGGIGLVLIGTFLLGEKNQ